jgi:hypothetical protein
MNEELRSPKVLTEIGRCIQAGMSYTELKRHLQKNFSVESTPSTIKKVYEVYLKRRNEVVAGKQEIQEDIRGEIQTTIIDTQKVLKNIHEFVMDLMDRCKHKDDRLALDASREILNQLYYQEKVLNKMQAGIQVENLNKIEITQIVVNELESLETNGRIKILDPMLRAKQTEKFDKIIDVEEVEENEAKDEHRTEIQD